MIYEKQLDLIKFLFKDSLIEMSKSKLNVSIKYGYLKRVMNYLYDEGINFNYKNGEITFNKNELRMIELSVEPKKTLLKH
jgi:hypothetical protein